jgi:hypothetical protein
MRHDRPALLEIAQQHTVDNRANESHKLGVGGTAFRSAQSSETHPACDAIVTADPMRGSALPFSFATSPNPTSGAPTSEAGYRTVEGAPIPYAACRRATLQIWRI